MQVFGLSKCPVVPIVIGMSEIVALTYTCARSSSHWLDAVIAGAASRNFSNIFSSLIFKFAYQNFPEIL
jgi:hypothetical protein